MRFGTLARYQSIFDLVTQETLRPQFERLFYKGAPNVWAAPSLKMAKKEKNYGTIKRFGARYGRTVKHKFAEIENAQKAKYKCPFCNYVKVRRFAIGIWHCTKCGTKFANRAYTVTKTRVKED